jgi:cyclopropane-fatty-acyl-phospholipid synthase
LDQDDRQDDMSLGSERLGSADRPSRPDATRRRQAPPLAAQFAHAALARVLRRIIRTGSLTIVAPDGAPIMAGDGLGGLTVRIGDWRTLHRLVTNTELALGEGYMDGAITIEGGELWDLLELVGRNLEIHDGRPATVSDVVREHVAPRNGRASARRHVAHHYDLSLELYRRFLDDDLQYSCAYFERPDMSLEEAQSAKKRHLAGKLLLAPGLQVLDIGCGWGGLALSLAEDDGVDVTGVTLSQEQLAVAQDRARDRQLDGRVRFRLEDYRDVEGSFDRIVSVGMFEHVGKLNYQAYFDAIARLLRDDGVAVVHAIGHTRETGATASWIAKYIFPGGYIAALSEVLPAIERAGLWVTDIEILRLHYAETLKAWRARFAARRGEIARLYDERFCRMWEFYLALSEMAFRHRGCMVFQIQLAKRVDALPITRAYMEAPAGR